MLRAGPSRRVKLSLLLGESGFKFCWRRRAEGPGTVRIDHIGSISTHGLAAKSILDLQVSIAMPLAHDELDGVGRGAAGDRRIGEGSGIRASHDLQSDLGCGLARRDDVHARGRGSWRVSLSSGGPGRWRAQAAASCRYDHDGNAARTRNATISTVSSLPSTTEEKFTSRRKAN